MDPAGPMPALDLSRMRRLDAAASLDVLDVLVVGLEHARDPEHGHVARFADDDDPEPATFASGPHDARTTLPMRRARDAWRLAVERGLVPATWLDDPRRCFPDQEVLFFCAECGGMGATGYNYDDVCNACNGRGNQMRRGHVPLPTQVHEVGWMLGHPRVVEAAEALARDAVQRLAAMTAAPLPDRVQWGRVRTGKPLGTVAVVIASPVWELAPLRPVTWDWDRMAGPAFERAPWWPEARMLDSLTRRVLCFDVGMAWAHAAAGVERSPFEPLLRLWELGVMIEELTADTVVLERARHRHIRSWRSGVPFG